MTKKQGNQLIFPTFEVITILTLVNVKAPEVTYNALVSAIFRTGAGGNAIPTVIIMFVSAWFNLMFDNTWRTDHR